MIAAGIAPGLSRRFAGEALALFPRAAWDNARAEARAAEQRHAACSIDASDRDHAIIEVARRNAERAGVGRLVRFRTAELSRFQPPGEFGCIVANPPYGERLGEELEVAALSREMGKLFGRLSTWSLFVLTAQSGFERQFGRKATKNRKLYNGNLRCWLYQYFGPLPPSPPPA
jgi:putative N6-adenine-specific DNA methylase